MTNTCMTTLAHPTRDRSRSRFLPLLLPLLALATPLWCAEPTPAPVVYQVTVTPDRADATYAVSAPITFTVAVTHDGKPAPSGSVSWSLTKDGVDPTSHGEVPVTDGTATVNGMLAEPGFLQCKAVFTLGTATARGLGAAAIAPHDLRASLPPPDDFDAFWAAQKQALAKIPLNARMTPTPTTVPGIELFDVQADAIGEPMHGWYARPKGAAAKSLPAIITLEGAGVYQTRQEPWLNGWAKDGFISLELNAHGLPNDKPVDWYLGLERGALKDYQFSGRESRERFYFLHMYLRDLQGINFLAAQPEWDGRVLIASGASQGGAQAIFLAAEDPRVTFLAAPVPAMCDHAGMLAGRVPGWPRLVPVDKTGTPDPAALTTSRYFDSANFATRIRIPALFVAGFNDQIAPPTSVYVAYNSLAAADKEMIPAVHSPHRIEPEVWAEVRKRILARK